MDFDPFVLVGVLGGGTYLVRRLLRRDREDASDLTRMWEHAARHIGGTVEGSDARYGKRTLRASIDGAVVVLTADTESRTKGEPRLFTRLRAGPLLGLTDVDLRIARRGILGVIARKLHLREIATGDAKFDEAFRVTGTSPIIRELLDARTRRSFLDIDEGLDIDTREIEMEREGHPESVEMIEKTVRHVETFVRRWNERPRAFELGRGARPRAARGCRAAP